MTYSLVLLINITEKKKRDNKRRHATSFGAQQMIAVRGGKGQGRDVTIRVTDRFYSRGISWDLHSKDQRQPNCRIGNDAIDIA